jgi:hypothetical protein
MPRGPRQRASHPGATASVLSMPGAHRVSDTATVHRWHGAHTSSYRTRSPAFCPSRRPLSECSRFSGAEESAAPSRAISRISTESVVRRGLDHTLGWLPASGLHDLLGRLLQWPSVASNTPPAGAASSCALSYSKTRRDGALYPHGRSPNGLPRGPPRSATSGPCR